MSADFHFKQFLVHQDGAAHKVGVDSVMLGAWCKQKSAENILDIGAGTGLLSLMMAQKYSQAKIDAVEIDKAACDCAAKNFINSKFSNKLLPHNTSIQNFKSDVLYDLIICNPPYFTNGVKPGDESKARARHDLELSIPDLYESIGRLLHTNGYAWLIVPNQTLMQHLKQAKLSGLNLVKRCSVKPKPEKEANRELLCFSRECISPDLAEIVVRGENNRFTDAYKKLTREFYKTL